MTRDARKHVRAEKVELLRPFEFGKLFRDILQKRLRIGLAEQGRQRLDDEAPAPVELRFQTALHQGVEVSLQALDFPGRQFDHLRNEEGLSGYPFGCTGLLELLKGDSFVGRMLVDQHETVAILANQIGAPVLADDPEAREKRLLHPALSLGLASVAGWLGRQDDFLPDLTPRKRWGNSLKLVRPGG